MYHFTLPLPLSTKEASWKVTAYRKLFSRMPKNFTCWCKLMRVDVSGCIDKKGGHARIVLASQVSCSTCQALQAVAPCTQKWRWSDLFSSSIFHFLRCLRLDRAKWWRLAQRSFKIWHAPSAYITWLEMIYFVVIFLCMITMLNYLDQTLILVYKLFMLNHKQWIMIIWNRFCKVIYFNTFYLKT